MLNKINILKPFLEEPTKEFNVREISRLLKISPATASKELKKLSKERILNERKERIFNLYNANLENEKYMNIKLYYNLEKLRNTGLIKALNKFYLKPTIILFGSASQGRDTETSDFDILIISENTKMLPEISKFEKKLNRSLQLFLHKNIKDIKNKHLINNVLNGITIQGKLKWI